MGQDIEQTMETLGQLLRPEVFAEGSEKRERELLLRLLVRRFGALPESVTQRVASASTPEIERWFDRAVDAASIDDVFATT